MRYFYYGGKSMNNSVKRLVSAICRGYKYREKEISKTPPKTRKKVLDTYAMLNRSIDDGLMAVQDEYTRGVVKVCLIEGSGYLDGMMYVGRVQFYDARKKAVEAIAKNLNLI